MKKKNTKTQKTYSDQQKIFALQSYEKGLLSAQTLLDVMGFDAEQEIENKRFEIQRDTTITLPVNKDQLCNKIEHARRNIEVVSRVVGTFQDDIKKKMNEVIMLNLEILKEISKL